MPINDNEDKALDPQGVMEWTNARGFDYTLRQVQRMFDDRKLPVFFGPCGRKLFVWRSHLEASYRPDATRCAPKRSVTNL